MMWVAALLILMLISPIGEYIKGGLPVLYWLMWPAVLYVAVGDDLWKWWTKRRQAITENVNARLQRLEQEEEAKERKRRQKELEDRQHQLAVIQLDQQLAGLKEPQVSPDRRKADEYVSKREIDCEMDMFKEVVKPILTDVQREKAAQRMKARIQNDRELSGEAKQRLLANLEQLRKGGAAGFEVFED